MDRISKRPLVVFGIFLIFGILVSANSDSIIVPVSAALVLLTVLFSFSGVLKISRFLSRGIIVFFIIGAFEIYFMNLIIYDNFKSYGGLTVTIKGYAASEPEIKNAKISCIINVEEISEAGKVEKKKGKILLSTVNDKTHPVLHYGDKLMFEGTLNLPSGMRNPSGFDYKKYLARKGVSASVYAMGYSIKRVEGRRVSPLITAGMKIRLSIARVIEDSLPPQQAGLMNGMLTGYTEGLSDNVKEAFSDAGLSHIMAVSGANVAFVAIPVIYLLRLLRLGKRTSNTLVISFLIFFVYITGFEPSVLRSVIMAVTVLAGAVIWREGDIFTTIAFSAILLLIVSPHMLFNIGFQLSYVATLSLVLLGKPFKNMIKIRFIPGKLKDVLAATIAAQAGVLPVTAVYFNKVSLVSLASNLLVVPLLEIITILGMAMAALGHIYIGFARVIGYVNCVLLSFVLYVTEKSSGFSFSTVKIATPGILLIILYYLALWFFLLYKPVHNIRIRPAFCGIAAALFAVILSVIVFTPGKLEIVFLDVGEGDCAFIKTSTGCSVLIDGGGKAGTEGDRIGEAVVVPFLLDKGIVKLDAVIATHGHDDHIKGLEAVLREIGVKKIIIPDLKQLDEFGDLLKIAEKKGTQIKKCSAGDEVLLDDKTFFEVLSPVSGFCPDKTSLNNSSLVLKLHYGKTSALFTGDISAETEQQLISAGVRVQADILKIAHHGSVYSSSLEFIKAVNPAAAVISVGSNNFGHPGLKVVERLADNGITVLRTDYDGAVVFTSDGNRIRAHTTVQKEQAE